MSGPGKLEKPADNSAGFLLPESRLKRLLYLSAGLVCVGLGYLGAILPVMPHTPFFILASYCFARSSPRLHRWLRRTPYIGHLLRDWEEHKGIRPRVKATAVCMVVVVVSCSVYFSGIPDWAKWCAAGLAALGIGTILFLVPTVKNHQPGS